MKRLLSFGFALTLLNIGPAHALPSIEENDFADLNNCLLNMEAAGKSLKGVQVLKSGKDTPPVVLMMSGHRPEFYTHANEYGLLSVENSVYRVFVDMAGGHQSVRQVIGTGFSRSRGYHDIDSKEYTYLRTVVIPELKDQPVTVKFVMTDYPDSKASASISTQAEDSLAGNAAKLTVTDDKDMQVVGEILTRFIRENESGILRKLNVVKRFEKACGKLSVAFKYMREDLLRDLARQVKELRDSHLAEVEKEKLIAEILKDNNVTEWELGPYGNTDR